MAVNATGEAQDTTNADNIEARFEALYESMMEKKLDFKESIEPFKVDNENASKG